MGAGKFILKVILIPVVLVAVIVGGIFFLIKLRRGRRERELELEAGRRQFQKLQQYHTNAQFTVPTMQPPEPALYKPQAYAAIHPLPGHP